jgi:hypothetical protein
LAKSWLGWLPFCPPLAMDKSPLWSGLQNKKFLKKRLISHSLHASCNNYNVRAVCVLGYLLLHCIFSSLAANYNWLGTCHYNWLGTCQFFLMLQQLCMQCNAMQYLVEHSPLLITVYLQLIFGKSCRNNVFFGKKKKKKETTRENLTTLIWIFQNFNNSSH